MYKYSILLLPSHNRLYTSQASSLALAELHVANIHFDSTLLSITREIFGGVDYITFETISPLDEEKIQILSRLSFVYAIFEIKEGGFIPVTKASYEYFEDDLVTIQKYSGKTNESFTRMMMNIAVLTGGWLQSCSPNEIHILDPICGRGTTLFEALIQGYPCTGIEIDKKQCTQLVQFFSKYLKLKKYKHRFEESKITNHKGSLGQLYAFTMAKNKEDFKADRVLTLHVIHGDTLSASQLIRKQSYHCIVGDLPYGIQHGSKSPSGSFTRNPAELLKKALPQWVPLLKPNGTIVLSWNTFVLKKEEVVEILENHGLTVYTNPPFDQFQHRVDQAIQRDLIAAKKISQ